MILEAVLYLDSLFNSFGGNGCHGVGSKLCPTMVFVFETNSSTLKTMRAVKRHRVKRAASGKSRARERKEVLDETPIRCWL